MLRAEIKVFVKYVSTLGAVVYLTNLTFMFIIANLYGSVTYSLDFLGHWVEPWLIPFIAVGLLLTLYWERGEVTESIPVRQ